MKGSERERSAKVISNVETDPVRERLETTDINVCQMVLELSTGNILIACVYP